MFDVPVCVLTTCCPLIPSAPKRVGGTAVASQLYRTSSFSSGRSSAADQEDMYSDASLEDDVLDLNHKVRFPCLPARADGASPSIWWWWRW